MSTRLDRRNIHVEYEEYEGLSSSLWPDYGIDFDLLAGGQARGFGEHNGLPCFDVDHIALAATASFLHSKPRL
ncbi:hypothetical protein [Paracoccus aminophilus]|uniref:hypothetical protein n=1 Tax=Paracoccus aminophilus TaxID=34003 RepID=UPI0011DDE61B|nr:hypothetical protein [Paracoccus aminophilus]